MAIFDVPTNELILRVADELKKFEQLKPPLWAAFVKTGHFKERPPTNPDWWYVRLASILRKLAILGPIGVSKLRTAYGGRKNRGVASEAFYKGSGSIVRKGLQQLETAGLAKKVEKAGHKGRIATPAGLALLDKVASQLMAEKGIVIPKKPEGELKLPRKAPPTKPRAKKATKEQKAIVKTETGPKEQKGKEKVTKRQQKKTSEAAKSGAPNVGDVQSVQEQSEEKSKTK